MRGFWGSYLDVATVDDAEGIDGWKDVCPVDDIRAFSTSFLLFCPIYERIGSFFSLQLPLVSPHPTLPPSQPEIAG